MENSNLVKQEVALLPFETQQGFEAVQRVCKMLTMSELVPKIYQAGGDAASQNRAMANCMIAFEMASRIGASPLMVMQNMYIVHSQPAWSSKFLIATINSSGRFSPLRYEFKSEQGKDDWGCRCFAYDKTDHEKKEPLYGAWVDISMSKNEGWYTKSGSKWKTMPQLMLQYRAAAFWARTYAPELSMGIKTDDEVADIIDIPYEEIKSKHLKQHEILPDDVKDDLTNKLSNCNNADEIDMLFDTLDDNLKNNHFVKKLFAARRATVNIAPATATTNGNDNGTPENGNGNGDNGETGNGENGETGNGGTAERAVQTGVNRNLVIPIVALILGVITIGTAELYRRRLKRR